MSENIEKKGNIKSSRKAKRIVISIVGGIVALILVFGITVNAYNKIPNNTYAAGINISGLSIDEAEKAIQAEADNKLKGQTVRMIYNGEICDIGLDDIEPIVNAGQTAEEIAEKRLGKNIFSKMGNILTSRFKKSENVLDISLNDEKLSAKIDEFTVKFEQPAKECSFELDGQTLKIFKGEDGNEFNHDKIKEDIYNSIASLKFNDIDLRIEKVEPKEVIFDDFYAQITAPAVDAYYEKIDGKISVNPGTPHIDVDRDSVKKALNSKEKVSEITVTTTQPSVTKDYLLSKMFVDKMGSYTSKFNTANAERSSNVRLSASKINNYVLLPGEVFSYDNTVGPRTKANGFKDAPVYIGNKVESGVGGGICQTSSTLYSAVLYANLEIVERTSHSLPVSYMPDGQDATIAQGYIDFKFKNNTQYPVKIVTYTNGGSLTCELYGVKESGVSVRLVHSKTGTIPSTVTRETDASIPVGYKKISQKGSEGYRIASTRIVSVNGVERSRETLTPSVYNAKPTIEIVNPSDINTPTDSLSIYSGKAPEASPQPSAEVGAVTPAEASQNANTPQAQAQTQTQTETITVPEANTAANSEVSAEN